MNTIFLSELANPVFIEYMNTRGCVIFTHKDTRFDPRICTHPDLVLTVMEDLIILDENIDPTVPEKLDQLDIPYVSASSKLSPDYPNDIAYNIVTTKEVLIHNLEYTNPLLALHSKYTNKHLIQVKQGYTKCSTVVVDQHHLITSDRGIYDNVKDYMEVLLIQPGHVELEGFEFGFLGGASATLDDTVVFHGDLSKHPDYQEIVSFIESARKKVLYFHEFPLTDIGSGLIFKHEKCTPFESTKYQRHVNIPIFISHEGCPNDCVFCNQRKITAKPTAMTSEEIDAQINAYSSSLDKDTYIELAFFGGSFTGISPSLQEEYLNLAYEYKTAGTIHAIRLSTRPDYISRDILNRLKCYGVTTIELGVQSLHEEVLLASNRGHHVSDVYHAVELIKEYGFQLGIQLMVGLPEDTMERSVLSSRLAALLKPDFVRIYPTLVIQDTKLLELSDNRTYHPLSLEEGVVWTKEMYQVFLRSHIPVIRVGLQPTDLIAEGKEVQYGPFHPAFRQLVETSYFLEEIKRKLTSYTLTGEFIESSELTILCNPKDLSQVIGHKRSNILALKQEYPKIRIKSDEQIEPMKIKITDEI